MRSPGEFQAKHEVRVRQNQIYRALNEAAREAREKGTSQVVVSGRRFFLSGDPLSSDYFFLRLRKYGLVFCRVVDKDHGYQETILPDIGTLHLSKTKVDKKFGACVLRVEDAATCQALYFEPVQPAQPRA